MHCVFVRPTPVVSYCVHMFPSLDKNAGLAVECA